MSATWPTAILRDVMRLDLNRESIDPGKTYAMVGVLSFARGLFDREPIENGNTSYKHFLRLKPNHIVMSQLFGWEGALALSDERFAGKYLSPQFPTFLSDESRLDRNFLGWLMRRPIFWLDLGMRASGMGDRRRTLKPEALFACQIPLPPLDEQRRIVARIEELAAMIEEAQRLKLTAINEQSVILRQALKRVFDLRSSTWTTATVDDIALSMDAGWSPQCENAPADFECWGVLKTTAVQWCEFWPHENKRLPPSVVARPDLSVKAGDVLVTRAGPKRRVGVPATVREDHPKLMISDKIIRIRPKPEKVDPRFLEYALSSSQAQEHLVVRKTGLADAQVNISQSILRATPFSYPSLGEQKRIVAELDVLQSRVSAVKSLQNETAAELEAMLPAILDKAFNGEL